MPSQILYSEPIVIFEKLTKEVRGESTFLHGDESCWVFFQRAPPSGYLYLACLLWEGGDGKQGFEKHKEHNERLRDERKPNSGG
jgi:hypothetical protein